MGDGKNYLLTYKLCSGSLEYEFYAFSLHLCLIKPTCPAADAVHNNSTNVPLLNKDFGISKANDFIMDGIQSLCVSCKVNSKCNMQSHTYVIRTKAFYRSRYNVECACVCVRATINTRVRKPCTTNKSHLTGFKRFCNYISRRLIRGIEKSDACSGGGTNVPVHSITK